MLTFDVEKKLLDAYKIKHPKPSYVYKKDDMKISYEKYFRTELLKDILLFVDKLNATVAPKITKEEAKPFHLRSYEVKDKQGQLGVVSAAKEVYVNIACSKGDLPIFKLVSLPVMDDCGLLERAGKKYALIREMVQDNDITIVEDGGRYALKIIADSGNYVNICNKPEKPLTKFRKDKIKIPNVIYGLAEYEGLDQERIKGILVSPALSRMYADKQQSEEVVMAYGYSMSREYIERIKSPEYAITRVRDRLNEAFSIDRALGKTLSRSIKLPNGTVIKSGKVVTTPMLTLLKHHKVNELFVRSKPMYNGWFLARPIIVPHIIKGTKIIDAIKEDPLVQGLGDYASETVRFVLEGESYEELPGIRTIVADHIPMLYEGVEISEEVLQFLIDNSCVDESNGNTVCLKQKLTEKNPDKFINVPLEVSIVGNRHFKAVEVGIKNSQTEWVYMEEDGSFSAPKDYLCTYDYIAMLSLYDRVFLGEDVELLASNDLGLRKKLNQTSETFSKAWARATAKFFKNFNRSIKEAYEKKDEKMGTPDDLAYLFRGLEGLWWEVIWKDMKVASLIDRTNPMAFYSALHTVKSIFADKNGIPEGAHLMTMGHYGRLCPYETPSGKALGITLHKAILCDIRDGVMRTPYHPVTTNKTTGETRIDLSEENIQYFTVAEEEHFRIADISSLVFDENTGLVKTKGRVPARVPARDSIEKVTVSYIDVGLIQYVNVDPNQIDSLVASTIPFQGSDDSARVVFETSMCKQAKGLLNGEIPTVGTSAFVDTPRLSTYFMIHAEYDGEVLEASNYAVVVKYDTKDEPVTYNYRATEYSNDSLIVRTVVAKSGQRVKAGDILVTSNYVKDGEMVTGVNALVAFVPKGANYEDGVFAAERISQKLVSYGTKPLREKIDKRVSKVNLCKVIYNKYINVGKTVMMLVKTIGGIKNSPKSVKSEKSKGFIIDARTVWDEAEKRITSVEADLVSIDPLHEGDKLANRHGNKGVTPTIRSNDQMLQFSNGEFVDIIYNPAGVASRMNIGQILECNLGLVCYILGIRARSDSFNGASTEEVKMLLHYVWDLAHKDNVMEVVRDPQYKEIPQSLHTYCVANIKHIRRFKGAFNPDGTAWLYNPKTKRMLEQPAVVGINYIYKLIHESTKKIQARGGYCTEPYLEKTQAPTHGISKHGGQRIGYMELDAYSAYGAAELLHELENERGDNPIARNNFTVDALHNGDGYKLDERYAIRRSTEEFAAKLRALGVVIDFEGELPNDTPEYTKYRNVYTTSALIKATSNEDAAVENTKSEESILNDII